MSICKPSLPVAARVELDAARRSAALEEAQLLQNKKFFYVPLHQQVTPWLMRRQVDATYRRIPFRICAG